MDIRQFDRQLDVDPILRARLRDYCTRPGKPLENAHPDDLTTAFTILMSDGRARSHIVLSYIADNAAAVAAMQPGQLLQSPPPPRAPTTLDKIISAYRHLPKPAKIGGVIAAAAAVTAVGIGGYMLVTGATEIITDVYHDTQHELRRMPSPVKTALGAAAVAIPVGLAIKYLKRR